MSSTTQVGRAGVLHLVDVDRLVLGYLGLVAAMVLVRSPASVGLLSCIAVIALALVAAASWAERSRAGRWVHDFAAIALIIVLFTLSGAITAVVNPIRGDELLASLDARWFERLVVTWQRVLGRPSWLTDAAALAYASFYFVPVVMALALYRRGNRREFQAFRFDVVATFLVSFLGYLALPATGPRLPRDLELAWLGGGRVTSVVMALLHTVERNLLDAFPSGHAAVSLVCLALGWRLFPRWRSVLIAVTAGILFSTVYLSLHYVTDLVAGAMLAAAMTLVLPPMRRMCAGPSFAAAGHQAAVRP